MGIELACKRLLELVCVCVLVERGGGVRQVE